MPPRKEEDPEILQQRKEKRKAYLKEYFIDNPHKYNTKKYYQPDPEKLYQKFLKLSPENQQIFRSYL